MKCFLAWTKFYLVLVSISSFFLTTASFAGTKYYDALVGNHEYIALQVHDTSLALVVSHMNGRNIAFQLDFNTHNIVTEETIQDIETTRIIVTPSDSEYIDAVLKMRDFIAYVASPTSLENSCPAPKILRPELNETIEKLNALTLLKQQELANCVLFPEADEKAPWFLSAGVHGLLGKFEDNVSRIWVRQGYELVLMSNKEFVEAESVVITAKGDGVSTGPGLPVLESMPLQPIGTTERSSFLGAHYTLAQSELYHHLGSVVCRPDLSNAP